MPKITLVTPGGTTIFENDTVENVAQLLAQTAGTLNIGQGDNIAVNGAAATGETPLRDGDEVSTVKAAGAKGE